MRLDRSPIPGPYLYLVFPYIAETAMSVPWNGQFIGSQGDMASGIPIVVIYFIFQARCYFCWFTAFFQRKSNPYNCWRTVGTWFYSDRNRYKKHYALVQRIATLIRDDHYSPYAVLKKLDEEGFWPSGLRICEKTLYNWVKQGDIPGVSRALGRRHDVQWTQGITGVSAYPWRHVHETATVQSCYSIKWTFLFTGDQKSLQKSKKR